MIYFALSFIYLLASRYNSPGDNKMIRERIQTKVLSSLSQPQQSRLNVSSGSCEAIEPEADISVRVYPVRHWKLVHIAVTTLVTVLSTVEYRRAEKVEMSHIIAQFNKTDRAKRKLCHAKLVIHGLNDPKGERCCYALTTRGDSTFATVRPIYTISGLNNTISGFRCAPSTSRSRRRRSCSRPSSEAGRPSPSRGER